MVLLSQLKVGLLDSTLIRIFADTQHIVKISLRF